MSRELDKDVVEAPPVSSASSASSDAPEPGEVGPAEEVAVDGDLVQDAQPVDEMEQDSVEATHGGTPEVASVEQRGQTDGGVASEPATAVDEMRVQPTADQVDPVRDHPAVDPGNESIEAPPDGSRAPSVVEPGEIGPAEDVAVDGDLVQDAQPVDEVQEDSVEATHGGTPEVASEPEPGGGAADTSLLKEQAAADDFNSVLSRDRQGSKRLHVSTGYPAEYVQTDSTPPDIRTPHESPQGWADQVNSANGDNNCGECTRAVQENWEGHPSVASVMADADAPGEPNNRMSEWTGVSPEPASMDVIQSKLDELGPGSSAVIGCDWTDGGGHWFNAINEDGVITAVDGQSGEVETWPPSIEGLGFDQSDMIYSEVVYFDANGEVIR